MTPPGKSAARRLAPDTEPRETTSFEPAGRDVAARAAPARAGSARDKLLAFPGFEPRPPRRREVVQPEAPAPEPDLGAELEAALMGDLQSMVNLFDDAARDPAPAVAAADPDQEALERLLASIRQGDGSPRPAAPPLDEAVIAEPIAEPPAARAPAAKRVVASPRPSGRSERMAPPAKARPRGDKPPVGRAEPAPALRLAIPGSSRVYLKPVIAISALILLATVGAGMTIRALTARNDSDQAATATASPVAKTAAAKTAATSAPEADIAEATGPASAAPAAEAAPVAPMAASPAADTRAAAEPPQSAMPETPRLALDHSATMQATAMVEAGKPPVAEPVSPDTSAFVAPETSSPLSAAELALQAPVMASPLVAPEAAAPEVTEPTVPAPARAAKTEPVAKSGSAASLESASKTGTASSGAGLRPGSARIASGVKLRTNPDNGAPVIGLLAAGAGVEIVSCKGWCEIVAGDKRGYVYQKFLSQAGG